MFIGAFARTAGLRVVLWQIPLGNTKMRAENNTWEHYQDNKVEWLLGDTDPGPSERLRPGRRGGGALRSRRRRADVCL